MSTRCSVAMAVYNGEKYLPVQLDSILSQIGDNDEIVISYDKSKDNTLNLIKEYANRDSRIKVYENPSSGVTGNFENALYHCEGDYIFICDQDDKWISDKLDKVLDCFAKTNADMVIHNAVHTDIDLNPMDKTFFEIYPIGDGKIKNIVKPRMSGCCMAFTKQMKEIILPIPRIQGYDQWLAVIAEFMGKIAYLDDVLLLHRLHDANVTEGKRRKLSLILRMRTRLIVNIVKRIRRERKKSDERK